METTTRVTVINSDEDSDDDANGIATTLPVIIQIKVKPDRRRQSKWRLADAKEFTKNDERHRSERYLSYRDDFRRSNSELTAEYWRETEDTRETWQIFERKPSDQFNHSLRETLSKSLSDAVLAGIQVTSPRELLQHSSGSECRCDLETSAAEILSEIPILPMQPSSTASSRCSSVIEQKLAGPSPFSTVIEVANPNGTLERNTGK